MFRMGVWSGSIRISEVLLYIDFLGITDPVWLVLTGSDVTYNTKSVENHATKNISRKYTCECFNGLALS